MIFSNYALKNSVVFILKFHWQTTVCKILKYLGNAQVNPQGLKLIKKNL